MNTEPRSPKGMSSSIWQAPRFKFNKKLWNFRPKNERQSLSELPQKIKKLSFRGDEYQFGPYVGTLADIREFAGMKGISYIQNGAIKYATK